MNAFNKDGYSMRNESSRISKVPCSAVQNTLHQLPFFLLILAKWSGTEQVTPTKAFLGFSCCCSAAKTEHSSCMQKTSLQES